MNKIDNKFRSKNPQNQIGATGLIPREEESPIILEYIANSSKCYSITIGHFSKSSDAVTIFDRPWEGCNGGLGELLTEGHRVMDGDFLFVDGDHFLLTEIP